MRYRYPSFRRELLLHDMQFEGGPPPGDPIPDFELATTEGDVLRRSDLSGRPFALMFGSVT